MPKASASFEYDEHEIVILPTASLTPHPENAEIYAPRDNIELKASIQAHGVMEPLVVKPDRKTVLGGVRRLTCALDLGIKEVPCIVRDFENDVIAIIELNRYRVKSPLEMQREWERLEPWLRERASANQAAVGQASKGQRRGEPLSSKMTEVVPIDVREELARLTGKSTGYITQLKAVVKSGNQDIIEKVDSGVYTVSQAYKELEEPGYQKPKVSLGPYFAGKTSMAFKLSGIIMSVRHRCYVEVFGGMANVLLNKPPSDIEVYNELVPDVVNVVLSVRDYPREVASQILLTPYSRWYYEQLLREITMTRCEPIDPIRAARWWCANFMTYLTIHHKPTVGNWHHSPVRNIVRSMRNHAADFLATAQRLQEVQITNQDWRQCLRYYDGSETVFYLDPPYFGTDQAMGIDWTPEEHKALADALKELKGRWVLTYNEHTAVRKMYAGHRIEEAPIRKNTLTRKNVKIDAFPNLIIYDLKTSAERDKAGAAKVVEVEVDEGLEDSPATP